MGQRAVSPVMGMVILAGLTAIVGLSVVVVGITVVDGAQSSAETTQAENSMVEFANTANDVAQSSTQSDSFELTGADDATTWVNESAGKVELSLYDNGTETWTESGTFGVLKQETSDDTEIAYQGGGVWKHEQGGVSMVSPPDLEYRDEPVPTLTFPVVQLEGDAVDSGALQGSLNVDTRDSVSNGINPLDGDYLTIDVQSRYCEGWENHLEDQTNTTFDERCAGDGRVVANMSVDERNSTVNDEDRPEEGDIDGAIVGNDVRTQAWNANVNVTGDIVFSDTVDQQDSGLAGAPGDVPRGHKNRVFSDSSSDLKKADGDEMFPLEHWEDRLDNRTEDLADATKTPVNSSTWYSGSDTHYIDIEDPIDDNTLKINATTHEQTLVFDDDLNLSSQKALMNVSGDEEVVIYVDGIVKFDGQSDGATSGNIDHPGNLTVVAKDQVYVTGQVPFHGVLIAPTEDARVDAKSKVVGALIGETAKIQTAEVEYAADDWQTGTGDSGRDDSAGSSELEGDLSYLHVTETLLKVND